MKKFKYKAKLKGKKKKGEIEAEPSSLQSRRCGRTASARSC